MIAITTNSSISVNPARRSPCTASPLLLLVAAEVIAGDVGVLAGATLGAIGAVGHDYVLRAVLEAIMIRVAPGVVRNFLLIEELLPFFVFDQRMQTLFRAGEFLHRHAIAHQRGFE